MPSGARFWDRWAARYARMPVPDPAGYERKLAMTQAAFPPQARVLEIGCGTGSTAIRHAPHVAHVQGIDYSGKMIEIARQRAAAAGCSNVSFTTSSAEAFEAAPGSFDAILALNLLHLLDAPGALVERAHRLLRPGGIFVTSTMCLAEAVPFMRPVAPVLQALGLFPRLWFLRGDDLRQMQRRAGFDIAQDWQPSRRKALFLIARRDGSGLGEGSL